jgi:Mn2+/Fe2+ NRAMP family transporter
MTKDQMRNCIYTRETRSDLNPVSKNIYSTITALIILCIFVIMTVPAVHAEDASDAESAESAESAVSDTGMEVTAALATIVYFPVKAVFSLTGGIVGGLTYWFSGGNAKATKKVWHASMEGDYMVEPENLTGEKPLNFIAPDE